MKPNIFDVATSELSQDAFLTWLFRWADQEAKSYNEKLHTCAKEFIKLLINKKINYNKNIENVSAGRQWKNIDIWAKINNEVLIVIEDKTSTFEHSDQLNKYKKFAEDWCKKNNYQLVLIYFETGLEYGGNTKVIENKDYIKIERSELISFFEKHSEVKNDIIEDFIERINSLETLFKKDLFVNDLYTKMLLTSIHNWFGGTVY